MGSWAAAIDCGTNSTRLLVAGPEGAPAERMMKITRLGEGVDRTGMLSQDAIARTLAALGDFAGVLDRYDGVRVRATATAAVRDAANAAAFLDPAEALLGTRPETLTGGEEGTLSFLGATAAMAGDGATYLVADVGGGSTELAVGLGGVSPQTVVSLPLGCVRMTERHLRSDPPSGSDVSGALGAISAVLAKALADNSTLGEATRMVGLAGTVTSLVAMEQRLERYERDRIHHATLTKDTVEGWCERLAAETVGQRREHRGLEPERAEVILGGALVVLAVMSVLGHSEMLVSESDILDGLVASVLGG